MRAAGEHWRGMWWLGLVALVALPLMAACGDDELSGEEITENVADAVDEEGMVYHAVTDDGSEIWLSPDEEKFRRDDVTEAGVLISVGEGWTQTEYDPLENVVTTEDQSLEGPTRPRIDDPMIIWFEPLGALAFAQEFNVIGETSADGRRVLSVEGLTPITSDGQPTGRVVVGRVDVDPETYLPLAYERREDVPPEQTPSQERVRIVYTTSELIPREDLPEDWFDPSVVEEQKLTVAENVELMRDLGLTPFWLGENYQGTLGSLSLPPDQSVFTDPENAQGEMHYALIVPTSETEAEPLLDAVVIRLGLNPDGFGPPTFPEYAGTLPESGSEITVRGEATTMYTSIATPADLGCGEVECPDTDARLYRRVVFSIDETVVQLEVFAKVNADGAELNAYNSVEGLQELAEALFEAAPE